MDHRDVIIHLTRTAGTPEVFEPLSEAITCFQHGELGDVAIREMLTDLVLLTRIGNACLVAELLFEMIKLEIRPELELEIADDEPPPARVVHRKHVADNAVARFCEAMKVDLTPEELYNLNVEDKIVSIAHFFNKFNEWAEVNGEQPVGLRSITKLIPKDLLRLKDQGRFEVPDADGTMVFKNHRFLQFK